MKVRVQLRIRIFQLNSLLYSTETGNVFPVQMLHHCRPAFIRVNEKQNHRHVRNDCVALDCGGNAMQVKVNSLPLYIFTLCDWVCVRVSVCTLRASCGCVYAKGAQTKTFIHVNNQYICILRPSVCV